MSFPSGYGDRLIPSYEAMQRANSIATYTISPPETDYEKMLVNNLFPNYSPRILLNRVPKSQEFVPPAELRKNWKFPITPSESIDAPDFTNDYYHNNLDWGKQAYAINLDTICYVYNTTLKEFSRPLANEETLSSIKWNPDGDRLACGNVKSGIVVVDAIVEKKISEVKSIDDGSALCIDWRNTNELTIGTSGIVYHYDLRCKSIVWQKSVNDLDEMEQNKTCSIRWHHGKSLLAVGCNANKVNIFDCRENSSKSLHKYAHAGAVKALSWLPNSSFLLSGGGSADRILKVFDSVLGKQICETEPLTLQITSIQFLDERVFALGLGFPPNSNVLTQEGNMQFWECCPRNRRLKKLSENSAQPGRILSIAKDPSSMKLCSISSNETLCFWKPEILPDKKPTQNSEKKRSIFSFPSIR